MDFSGTFQEGKDVNGLAILCDTTLTTYTGKWILRSAKSMQNPVYPGRWPVQISRETPTRFGYRLIIHHGSADEMNIDELHATYQKSRRKK